MSTARSVIEKGSDLFSRGSSPICRRAIDRALNYLIDRSLPKGFGWSDFPTNRSGESTSWVTAHVLWQIGLLLPHRISGASLQTLLSQRQEPAAWGFSEAVPPDCDSTVHVLGAITTLGAQVEKISRSIEFVLSHQAASGGFSTYADGLSLVRYRGTGDESNYEGWTQPHVCVTAVALEVLSRFPRFVPQRVLDEAIDFLLDTQTSEGYWESYWWRSKYFSTARIIKYLTFLDDTRAKAARDRAIDWLIRTASVRGYWDNGYDAGLPCPLSTSKCVEALVATDADKQLVRDGVAWLLENQNDDGSWTGTPVLQIPPPHVTRPSEMIDWRRAGRGVGACCVDERRIYTTASIGAILAKLGLPKG
jgi:squalene cyclase